MQNPPSAVKNQSKEVQKVFIDTFNAVLADTSDEEQARSAAWSNVKNEFKKEGDQWLKKEKKASEGVVEYLTEMADGDIKFDIGLAEAIFDDSNKTAIVTCISEGWSLNQTGGKTRYYTARAIEDVASLLNTSKKMYLEHSPKSRVINEWAATVLESWVETSGNKKHAKAKIDFTENPQTVWLYREAKKHPEQVGLSIDGRGEFREGKIEGRDAAIIEGIKILKSTDFVDRPAAGGRVSNVLESFGKPSILVEAVKSLGDRIKKAEQYQKPNIDFSNVLDAFHSLLSDLIYSAEAEDIGKEIETALDELEIKLKACIPAIKKNNEPEEPEMEHESVTTETVIQESVNTNKSNKEKTMELSVFKSENPEAYVKLSEEIKLVLTEDLQKANKEQLDKLTEELTAVKADLETSDTALKAATLEIDKNNDEKKLRDRKEFIDNQLKEAKIAEKVSATFIEILNKSENEDITKLIEDKAKDFAEIDTKLKGFGPTKPVVVIEKKIDDKESRKKLFLTGKE
jgi:cation transport regulator ChaB